MGPLDTMRKQEFLSQAVSTPLKYNDFRFGHRKVVSEEKSRIFTYDTPGKRGTPKLNFARLTRHRLKGLKWQPIR